MVFKATPGTPIEDGYVHGRRPFGVVDPKQRGPRTETRWTSQDGSHGGWKSAFSAQVGKLHLGLALSDDSTSISISMANRTELRVWTKGDEILAADNRTGISVLNAAKKVSDLAHHFLSKSLPIEARRQVSEPLLRLVLMAK
jgi:hypothetical protein